MTANANSPAWPDATSLNATCGCVRVDRPRLQVDLDRRFPGLGPLLEARPGLVSGHVVFIDADDARSMDRTVALAHRALTSRAFARQVGPLAPRIAVAKHAIAADVLGVDFHLGGDIPRLIEINTNPGGLLLNLELARALTGCCDDASAPLARLASGRVALDQVAARVVESFRAEWNSRRGTQALQTVAVVDDDPQSQYLYPEFLLYQRLFEESGWHAPIVDAAALDARADGIYARDARIDLVYNRVTDFYLTEARHAALRQACEHDLAVVTPHPAAHAHWADKRLLTWLRDESLLIEAGLDDGERAHLLHAIPPTQVVSPEHADDLWRRRKTLFFKPVDGFGGKAAYRGDKLTRATFEHILSNRYVAQAIVPTTTRHMTVGDQATRLKFDVRVYCSAGTTWLRAARLYRGQTTNFRTPGGGFAPVLTLPAIGDHPLPATGPAAAGIFWQQRGAPGAIS